MEHENLTPRKRRFIEYLKTIDLNKKRTPEIAEDIDISLSTFYRWLKDKELLKIAEREKTAEIEGRLPDILHTLVERALDGDIRAIKLFLERYDDNKDDRDFADKLTPDMVVDIIHRSSKEKKDKTFMKKEG